MDAASEDARVLNDVADSLKNEAVRAKMLSMWRIMPDNPGRAANEKVPGTWR